MNRNKKMKLKQAYLQIFEFYISSEFFYEISFLFFFVSSNKMCTSRFVIALSQISFALLKLIFTLGRRSA